MVFRGLFAARPVLSFVLPPHLSTYFYTFLWSGVDICGVAQIGVQWMMTNRGRREPLEPVWSSFSRPVVSLSTELNEKLSLSFFPQLFWCKFQINLSAINKNRQTLTRDAATWFS